MKIQYDRIKMKKRVLLEEGVIEIGDVGCYLIKGCNGCGKTLWLRRLHLALSGQSVFVSQNNDAIIYSEDVLHNISMSNDVEENEKIYSELENNGFKYLLNLKVSKMSGGERRLVSLFRGLYSTKDIILLDEPLNDLDYFCVQEIIKIIEKLKKDKLFIIVSHDDRFDRIADGYLNYNYPQISVGLNNATCSSVERAYEKEREITVFKKTNLRNLPSLILLLCMAIIFLSSFASNLLINDDTDKLTLGENQVNIYVPASSIGANMGIYGAFPVSIISEILSADASKRISLLGETEVKYNRKNRTNLNMILGCENVEVYPLEYYDYDKCQFYSPLDTYLAIKGYNNDDAIRTMPKFNNWLYDNGNNIVAFDENQFQEIVSDVNEKKNFEIVFIAVILNEGMTLEEFLQLEEIASLISKDDVYIQTNDTIEIYNQILQIIEDKHFWEEMIILCVLIALMDVGVWIIRLRAKRRIYFLFANMGVERRMLQKESFKHCAYLVLLIVWSIVVFVGEELIIKGNNLEKNMMNYLLCLCMMIIFFVTHFVKYRLFVNEINRAYKWDKR